MQRRVPSYMIPHKFILVDEFLYNDNGKLDRNSMLQHYYIQKKETGKIRKEKIQEQITIIENLLNNIIIDEEYVTLQTETRIKELDLNSLTYLEWIVAVEDEFCIEVSENVLSEDSFETVGQLIEYIDELIQKRGKICG